MARVRVTPIIRCKPKGFAGIPGYITKARPPTSIRRRETIEEWRAREDEKEREFKELQIALSIRKPDTEGFARMRTHWISMKTLADTQPHKDWKETVRRLRPKLTTKGPPPKYKMLFLKFWDRIDDRKMPRRGKGYWSSYRFLAHYYWAFVEIGVPEELMAPIAADNDHVDLKFSRWFFSLRRELDHYISWEEFSWCLFAYVRAYEN